MVRKGPLDTLTEGYYKGRKIDYIIRNNPRYFMTCVKEWLDISPEQARLFRQVTGGEIPDRYIKSPALVEDWTPRDEYLYVSNQDILPNWDFYPGESPEWWKEYLQQPEAHSSRPSVRLELYHKYEMEERKKLWQDFR